MTDDVVTPVFAQFSQSEAVLAFFEPSSWDHSFRLLHSSSVTTGASQSVRPVEDQTFEKPAIQTVQVKEKRTFEAEKGVTLGPNEEPTSGAAKEASVRLPDQAGVTLERKGCRWEEEEQPCGGEERMEIEPEICPEVRDLISRVEQDQHPEEVLQRAVLSGWSFSYIIITVIIHLLPTGKPSIFFVQHQITSKCI